MASDVSRADALMAAKYDVIILTKAQLYNETRFDVIARDVARRVGKRLRANALGTPHVRTQLRKELFAWHKGGGRP